MAVFDLEQQGLRLDDAELLALLARAAAPEPMARPSELVAADAALTAAGVLVEGAMVPTAARIVAILGAPAMEMHLECYIVADTYALDVSITRDGAVLSRTTPEGLTELRCVELAETPLAILRAVGLGRRNDPPCDHPITVPAAVLTDLGGRGDADGTAGVEALAAAGLDRADGEIVVLLLMQRRLSFRLTALWRDGDGADELVSREMTVIDGGRMGLWFSEADPATSSARLTPTNVRGVVAGVTALTPVQTIAPWD